MWTSCIMLFFVILFDRSKLDTWASYKLKDIHLYNCKWQTHMLWIIICRSYMCLCVCACAVCISSRQGQGESRESVIIMSLKRVTSGTWGPSSSTWGWGGDRWRPEKWMVNVLNINLPPFLTDYLGDCPSPVVQEAQRGRERWNENRWWFVV